MLRWIRTLAADLHARSASNWTARCMTCGHAFPYPGIRVGAAGRPCKLRRCPRCGKWRCCRIEPARAG